MKRLHALTAIAILRCGECLAADVAGSKDDPFLKRIEGSEILYYKASKFDEALSPWRKFNSILVPKHSRTLRFSEPRVPAPSSITNFHRRPQLWKAFGNMRRN